MATSKWQPFSGPGSTGRTQAERFYERYWQWITETGYHLRDAPPRLHVALRMLEELAPARDGVRTWLDAGCADGKLGTMVAERGLEFRAIGADISETALELAKEHYDEVIRWDATAASLPELTEPASVDALTCLDVIEHLFDPGQALEEFREVLRPGGLLVLATPNFAHYRSRLTVLGGEFPSEDQHIFHESDHLHYFTRGSLEALVRSSGFDVAEVEGTVFEMPRLLSRIDRRTGGAVSRRGVTLFARQLVLAARRI